MKGPKRMLKVTGVEPLSGYSLRLQYSDGITGEVGLTHLVGKGVFQLWNDVDAFRQVSIGSGGELRWSDDVDLCADALYLQLTGKDPDELFPSLKTT